MENTNQMPETTAEKINKADEGKRLEEIYHDAMVDKYGWSLEDAIQWKYAERSEIE